MLKAPYFASEVIGAERLDELAAAIFSDSDPAAVLHDRLTQELSVADGLGLAAARPAVRRSAGTSR